MRKTLLAVAVALLLVRTVPGQEAKDVPAALEGLRSSRLLEGSHVGEDKHEGAFWKRTRVLSGKGDQGLLRKLLADPHPLVRAAGLVCLAEAGAEGTEKTLRAHLGDWSLIDYRPAGVPVGEGSVGLLARELLADRNRVSSAKKSIPVLDERGLLAVDIEVLSRDDTPSIHRGASARIRKAAAAGKVELTFEGVRAASPGLPLWRAVKAVGRLPRTRSLHARLKAAYNDPDLPLEARLAAGSAVATREAHWELPDGIAQADWDRMLLSYKAWNALYKFTKGAKSPRDLIGFAESRGPELDKVPWSPPSARTIAALAREVDVIWNTEEDWKGDIGSWVQGRTRNLAESLAETPVPDWDHDADAPFILSAAFERYPYLYRREMSDEDLDALSAKLKTARGE